MGANPKNPTLWKDVRPGRMKTCVRCEEAKSVEDFHRNKKSNDPVTISSALFYLKGIK